MSDFQTLTQERFMAQRTNKGEAQEATPTAETQRRVQVDDSEVAVCYANFCMVSMLHEELVLDLGLSMQGFGAPPPKIKASHRVILNYHTAKRLTSLLHAAIQRY